MGIKTMQNLLRKMQNMCSQKSYRQKRVQNWGFSFSISSN